MVSRARALGAGFFLVGLVCLAVVVAMWVSGEHVAGRTYLVVAPFDVTGLVPHSRVLYRGLRAGEVESIHIDPESPSQILITIRVRTSIPVTRGTFGRLHLEGITGMKQVVLDDKFTDPRPLLAGNGPPRIPMKRAFLDRIADAGERILAQLEGISRPLSKLLSEPGMQQVRRIMTNLERATRGMVELEASASRQLVEVPAAAKAVLRDTGELVRTFQGAAVELRRQVAGLGNAGQGATRTLNQRTLPELNQTLAQLRRTAAEVQRLSESLRQNPQQLLGGPARPAPGPGEPGFRSGHR